MAFLSHNPLGIGMGLMRPRQGTFFPAVPAYRVEGALFQIAMDIKVWGSVVWLLFLLAGKMIIRPVRIFPSKRQSI